ncbi:sensor histidine kinase [Diplocloster hominis]|uniref:sensor histidine kinase n=1 Tax=Diplocloster hominis TaxID=3079010 RepID=UPI0031BB7CDA
MKSSFQKKLFLKSSIIIISMVLIFLIFFSNYVYREISKTSRNNLNELAAKTGNELTLLFDDMDKISLYVSTNPDIISAFHDTRMREVTNQELSVSIYNIITSITVPNSSSRFRINLFNDKRNFISTGIPYSKAMVKDKLSSEDYLPWYHSLPIVHSNSNITPLSSDTWNSKPTQYISLYREIFDSLIIDLPTGIVEIQCPSKFIDQIMTLDVPNVDSYLYTADAKAIYGTSDQVPSLAGLPFDQEEATPDLTPVYTIADDHVYSAVRLENGWILMLAQHQNQVFQIVFRLCISVLLISVCILLICLAVLFKIMKNTTEPLRQLTASVNMITLNSPYLNVDTSQYSNELVGLTMAFDEMMKRLKNSMEENVKTKAYEARANMIALQSQVNPHFICNILTIIKAMSKEQDTEKIGQICDYLARMLRYISAYDEEGVPMREEITDAETYLNLMKIRYEGLFDYELYINSKLDIDAFRVPKLFLQPLLENSFQHGFKKVVPPWHLKISCTIKNDYYWSITVQDNGVGITDEEADKIQKKLSEFMDNSSNTIATLKIGGMGLINTIARLKMRYPDSLTFQIQSLTEGGTMIKIGGKLDDEYFTC